jgi:hypothetical protein
VIATVVSFVQQNLRYFKLLFVNKEENYKDNIAIIIDISRPCQSAVEKFLKENRIEASILVMKSKDESRRLNPSDRAEWEELVKSFSKLVSNIYEKSAPKELHIFLSAPASLTFALGCVIGTLYKPNVYNYNDQTGSYDKVLTVTSGLK